MREIKVKAGKSVININTTKDMSAYYAALAKNWAVKSGDTVDGAEYSSKSYAQQAKETAASVSTELNETKNEILSEFETKSTVVLNEAQDWAQKSADSAKNASDNAENGKQELTEILAHVPEKFAGFSLFDTKATDCILTGQEAVGWALQGSLVTNIYSDAVNRIIEEYDNGDEHQETFIDYNSPNFSPTGNLSLVNGIAKDFSTANYFTVPKIFTHNESDTFELFFKIKTGSDISGAQPVIACGESDFKGFLLHMSSGSFKLFASSTGSSWNIFSGNVICSAAVNTEYRIKITYDGASYKVSYSLDSENYIESLNLTSALKLYSPSPIYFGFRKAFNEFWQGEIDLNECYIKVNGELWWEPYTKYNYTYKLAGNRHKITDITAKEATDKIFEFRGNSEFYVLDRENLCFYLPKNKCFVQYTENIDKVNEYIEAGLPDHKHSYTTLMKFGSNGKNWDTAYWSAGDSGSNKRTGSFSMASIDNSIYGNSSTVQPASTLKLLYYKVGGTIVNEDKIDVENVLSIVEQIRNDISGKAEATLSNCLGVVSKEFKKEAAHWCLPDYERGVNKSNNIIYTAECDGWLRIRASGSPSSSGISVYDNEIENLTFFVGGWTGGKIAIDTGGMTIVEKGQKYKFSTNGTVLGACFYPMKGA